MQEKSSSLSYKEIKKERLERAEIIARAGSIGKALDNGELEQYVDVTLSEAIVLGLLRQDVHVYLSVFGHGSTEIGEVLRIYEKAGLVRTYGVRNEIAASHAAAALRWVTGEKAAVVTSIGPGALQALAGSLMPASDGLGVWYLFGDETSEDEGPNMQQVPKHEQHPFLQLSAVMGDAYCLHTPGAVTTALRRGLCQVDHPHRPGPFYLLMPMNTQPAYIQGFNLEELPTGKPPSLGPAADDGNYDKAIEVLSGAKRIVVKVGGGARNAGSELVEFIDLTSAVAVLSPLVTGVIPYAHPRNMTVGGSKGSLCGNYAMEEADCLVAIGTRFVCQSDCSRTGYPNVRQVIHINTDLRSAMHYSKTTALVGEAAATLRLLNQKLRSQTLSDTPKRSEWVKACVEKRREWAAFKAMRYETPLLYDDMWDKKVLTQPAVIKTATDWARERDAVCFFDAGDVQANGFQIVEDDRIGRTFTDTGASYMGFAVSALLASALAKKPFYGLALSGDGSFTMNPQILIDGVQHGAKGCILLLDNRRMAAISGLQAAQYGEVYATSDQVAVDYVAWANAIRGVRAFHGGESIENLKSALEKAFSYKGLSLIHVPVYYGDDPLGGMGVFGRWNVGNWVTETQLLRHKIGL